METNYSWTMTMIPYWVCILLAFYLFRLQMIFSRTSKDEVWEDSMILAAAFYTITAPAISVTIVTCCYDNLLPVTGLRYALIPCVPFVLGFGIMLIWEIVKEVVINKKIMKWELVRPSQIGMVITALCSIVNAILLFISLFEIGTSKERLLSNLHLSNSLIFVFLEIIFLQGFLFLANLNSE